jgi:hypothetical protein
VILALVVALMTGGISASAAAAPREQMLAQLRAAAPSTLPSHVRQARTTQPRGARITPPSLPVAPPVRAFTASTPDRVALGGSAFGVPAAAPATDPLAPRSRAPPR